MYHVFKNASAFGHTLKTDHIAALVPGSAAHTIATMTIKKFPRVKPSDDLSRRQAAFEIAYKNLSPDHTARPQAIDLGKRKAFATLNEAYGTLRTKLKLSSPPKY